MIRRAGPLLRAALAASLLLAGTGTLSQEFDPAERAELRGQQGILGLEGKPTLVKGAHRLEGSRIEVHLDTQKLEVENARGAFQIAGEKSL